jgi:hypothetical protein
MKHASFCALLALAVVPTVAAIAGLRFPVGANETNLK